MKRVYFIKPIGMDGPVKIGFSRTMDLRLAAIQPYSPFPLELAASLEGDKRLERQFHAMFHRQHSHGEWFLPSAALTATIAAINGGSFNLEALPPPLFLTKPSREFLDWSATCPTSPEVRA